MYGRFLIAATSVVLAIGTAFVYTAPDMSKAQQAPAAPHARVPAELFRTADACMSCHNGLVTPEGVDISFGADWEASMMANSARDPYWQAAVRREVTDHPRAQAHIEDECSTCHMPMARFEAHLLGHEGDIFAHLPIGRAAGRLDRLAADGVSCTMCHQITPENFGTRESFVGGFNVDTTSPLGQRRVFGPYSVDQGRTTIMHSASGFRQEQSTHLQKSELCATCHTLYTETLGPDGSVIGELPEQVPYLEWRHSAYRDEKSCQSCHMPVVEDSVAISGVLGQPRTEVSRHTFRGGNFFMLRMLNRYRTDLGVTASPQGLAESARRTENHLQTNTAQLSINTPTVVDGTLRVKVAIENLAGHKLPTAYPSRRVWIHLTVRDRSGAIVFESGAFQPDGSIAGNDNDLNPDAYEPHYDKITGPSQVQVYETIMATPDGAVTTGLLSAIRFIKDNRLLPDGFDIATAEEDIAVQGEAIHDRSFIGGSDNVTYLVDVDGANGPFHVHAELWYQPIAYRWAQNLSDYDQPETNRFVGYYESMSDGSATILATGSASTE
ncbi:hypothetical protein CRI94_00525 [Longibacter salinarum]|uniref:Uncharacterized protein n=1 Tax=Longibacter salinarum TaxID=1850348 RepID=A0A2A8D1K0_9BACT|nr:hypothetical protein [Longibacter salinarum]PEN14815.1 hypothetical protein CRI94_00525 [Longibacter salinarum]